jgi:hypothetical protein
MFSWPFLESVYPRHFEREYIFLGHFGGECMMIAGAQGPLFPSRFGGEKVYLYYDNGEKEYICTMTMQVNQNVYQHRPLDIIL